MAVVNYNTTFNNLQINYDTDNVWPVSLTNFSFANSGSGQVIGVRAIVNLSLNNGGSLTPNQTIATFGFSVYNSSASVLATTNNANINSVYYFNTTELIARNGPTGPWLNLPVGAYIYGLSSSIMTNATFVVLQLSHNGGYNFNYNISTLQTIRRQGVTYQYVAAPSVINNYQTAHSIVTSAYVNVVNVNIYGKSAVIPANFRINYGTSSFTSEQFRRIAFNGNHSFTFTSAFMMNNGQLISPSQIASNNAKISTPNYTLYSGIYGTYNSTFTNIPILNYTMPSYVIFVNTRNFNAMINYQNTSGIARNIGLSIQMNMNNIQNLNLNLGPARLFLMTNNGLVYNVGTTNIIINALLNTGSGSYNVSGSHFLNSVSATLSIYNNINARNSAYRLVPVFLNGTKIFNGRYTNGAFANGYVNNVSYVYLNQPSDFPPGVQMSRVLTINYSNSYIASYSGTHSAFPANHVSSSANSHSKTVMLPFAPSNVTVPGHYYLRAWTTTDTGSDTETLNSIYTQGEIYGLSENITFYPAVIKRSYNLINSQNGGTGFSIYSDDKLTNISTKYAIENTGYIIRYFSSPTRDGYFLNNLSTPFTYSVSNNDISLSGKNILFSIGLGFQTYAFKSIGTTTDTSLQTTTTGATCYIPGELRRSSVTLPGGSYQLYECQLDLNVPDHYVAQIPNMFDGDIVFTPKWEPRTYNVIITNSFNVKAYSLPTLTNLSSSISQNIQFKVGSPNYSYNVNTITSLLPPVGNTSPVAYGKYGTYDVNNANMSVYYNIPAGQNGDVIITLPDTSNIQTWTISLVNSPNSWAGTIAINNSQYTYSASTQQRTITMTPNGGMKADSPSFAVTTSPFSGSMTYSSPTVVQISPSTRGNATITGYFIGNSYIQTLNEMLNGYSVLTMTLASGFSSTFTKSTSSQTKTINVSLKQGYVNATIGVSWNGSGNSSTLPSLNKSLITGTEQVLVTIPANNYGNYNVSVTARNVVTYSITYSYGSSTNYPTSGSLNVTPSTYNVETATITYGIGTLSRPGWSSPSISPSSITSGSTGNKTITVSWTANTYYINVYNAGTATNNSYATSTTETANSRVIGAGSKPGYSFAGWTLAWNGTNSGHTLSINNSNNTIALPAGVYGNINATAQWTANTYYINVINGQSPTNASYTISASTQYKTISFGANNTGNKAGYNFAGYTLAFNGANSGNTIAVVNANGNVTLPANTWGNINATAIWSKITYSITYNYNSSTNYPVTGDISPKPTTYDVETPTIVYSQDTISRIGWKDPVITPSSINLGSTGNKVVNVSWTANTYTITVDMNGGSTTINSSTYPSAETSKERTFTVPTRLGYSFNGYVWSWTNAPSASNNSTITPTVDNSGHKIILPAGLYGNITVTLDWVINTYNISLKNTGTSGAINNSTYQVSGLSQTRTLTNSTNNTGTKLGYNHSGWTVAWNTTGSGTLPSVSGTTLTIPANSVGNLNVTETWTAIPWSITYSLGGSTNYPVTGQPSPNPSTYTIETSTITFGSGTLSRPGWSSPSFSPSSIPLGSNSAKTVTVSWTANTYYINVYNAGTATNNSYATSTTETANSRVIGAGSKPGYSFAGWTLAWNGTNSGHTLSISGTNVLTLPAGVYGNINATAQWTANTYHINVINGQSPTNASYTISASTQYKTISFGTNNTSPKLGYNFAGYILSWNGTGSSTSISVVNANGNVTLPANTWGNINATVSWSKIIYSITYNYNGTSSYPTSGSLNVSPSTYDVETSISYGQGTLVRPGFSFSSITPSTIGVGNVGSRTINVSWTANTYYINVYNAGTATNNSYATSTTETANSRVIGAGSKPGYSFAGWTLEWNGTNSGHTLSINNSNNTIALPAGVYGNINATAQWTANTYYINVINGQSPTNASYTISASTQYKTISFGANNSGNKAGYNFAGYTLAFNGANSGNTITVVNANGNVTLPANTWGNINATATWSIIEYNISYVNGASVAYPVSGNINHATTNSTLPTSYNVTTPDIIYSVGTITRAGWKSPSINPSSITTGSTGDKIITVTWTANSYNINVVNGGTVTNNVYSTSELGSSATKTVSPGTKTGYIHNGYTFSFDANLNSGSIITSSGNTITLPAGTYGNIIANAKWTPIEYDITYINGGSTNYPVTGNSSPYPLTYNIESSTITFSAGNLSRPGWSSPSFSPSSITSGSTGNKTITVSWNPNTYYINVYNAGTATNNSYATSTTETANSRVIGAGSKPGYSFAGWTLAFNGVNSGHALTINNSNNTIALPAGVYGNINATAQWTGNNYNVTLDSSASGTMTWDTSSVSSYQTSTSSQTKVLVFNFNAGYSQAILSVTRESGSGGSIPTLNVSTLTTNGKVLITIPANSYGNFTIDVDEVVSTYSIIYNNGTTTNYPVSGGINHSTTNSILPTTYNVETPTIVYSQGTISRPGWSFGNISPSSIPLGSTGDKTIVVSWNPNTYYINVYNAGTATNNSYQTNTTETINYRTISAGSKPGYSFAGWTLAWNGINSGHTPVINNSNNVISLNAGIYGNINATAQWTANTYYINVINGQSPTNASYTISASTQYKTISFGANNTGNKAGYNFAGYTLSFNGANSGNTITVVNANGNVTLPANTWGNINATAIWSLIEYNISYSNGGTTNYPVVGNISPLPLTYNVESSTIDFIQNGISRPGWTFNTITNEPIPQGSTGNKSIVVLWNANTYTINVVNGGTVTNNTYSTSETESGTTKVVSPGTKTGYIHSGYSFTYSGSNSGHIPTSSGNTITLPAGIYGHIIANAKWTPIEYDITYINGGSTNYPVIGNISPLYPTYNIESSTIDFIQNGISRPGWTFNSILNDSIPLGSTGNKTITVSWNPNTYYINVYNAGTATNNSYSTLTTESTNSRTIGAGSKGGYTFSGWTLAWNGTNSGHTPVINNSNNVISLNAGIYGNIDATAQWTGNNYNIYFISSQTGEMTWEDTYDNTYQVSPSGQTKIFNFTFNSGYNSATLSITRNGPNGGLIPTLNIGTITSNQSILLTIPADSYGDFDIQIDGEAREYNVSYVNGASAAYPVIGNISPLVSSYNVITSTIVFVQNGISRPGWSFNAITPSSIAFGSTGDKTIIVSWNPNTYFINAMNTGTGSSSNTYSTNHTESANSRTINPGTKAGYNFIGWTLAWNGTNSGNTLTVSNLTNTVNIPSGAYGNIHATAQWSANTYYINVKNAQNPGNASYTISTSTQYKTISFGANNNGNKAGYNFAGYTLAFNGTNGGTLPTVTNSNGNVSIPANTWGNINATAYWTVITYAIDYNLGGTINYPVTGNISPMPESYNVESDTIFFTQNGISRAGWTFNNISPLNIPQGSIGNKTIKVLWDPNQYVFTFVQNKGTGLSINNSNTSYASFDSGVVQRNIVQGTRGGWTGNGVTFSWTNSNHSLALPTFNKSNNIMTILPGSYGNITITQDWIPNQYTITLNNISNTSEAHVNNSIYHTSESVQYRLLTNSSNNTGNKAGYNHKGWTVSWNGAGSGTLPTISGNNVTLYANSYGNVRITETFERITYIITYNNGKKDNYDLVGNISPLPETYDVETPTITFIQNGMYQRGWSFGGISPSSIPLGSIGNKTVVVNWIPNTYSISLEYNTVGISNAELSMSSYNTNFSSGTKYSEITLNYVPGKRFTGATWAWTNTPTLNNNSSYTPVITNYIDTNNATIALPVGLYGNFKVTLLWESNNYTIDFEENNDIPDDNNVKIPNFVYAHGSILTNASWNGTSANLSGDSENNNLRKGFTFVGWFYNSNLTGPVSWGTDTMPHYNLTLYAKYNEHKYNIVFSKSLLPNIFFQNTNSISGNVPSPINGINYYTSGNVIMPNQNTLSKQGYNFVGWARYNNLGGEQYNVGESYNRLTHIDNSTVTLYAHFEPSVYNVTYHLDYNMNGNTSVYTNKVYDQNLPLISKPENFVKERYSLISWRANTSNGTYSLSSNINYPNDDRNENIFYGVWRSNHILLEDKPLITIVLGNSSIKPKIYFGLNDTDTLIVYDRTEE